MLRAARAFAAGALAAGGLCFVVPEIAIDVWPWQLTPLTWLYLGGLTGTAGALVLLIRSTERKTVGPIHPGGSRWPSPVS